MASRIEKIFLLARDTLNDHQKERWSDDVLLRNLNLGIVDIAKQSGLFKNSAVIPLVSGQDVYPLPDHILRLSHATYQWEDLPLSTSGWMTKNREPDWRYTSSDTSIERCVFDEIKRGEIRIYPRPFGDFGVNYDEINTPYGVTVAMEDYTLDTPYGVLASLVDPDVNKELQNSVYGVLAGVYESDSFVVYYTEAPDEVTSIDQDPPVDSCFDSALKFYITGTAYRNDVDATNRNMATEEFVFYQRDLDVIKTLAATDSVAEPWFESHYNSMG